MDMISAYTVLVPVYQDVFEQWSRLYELAVNDVYR